MGFLHVYCTGFICVLFNLFVLSQGEMITTPSSCMQRQINASVAFTRLRWNQLCAQKPVQFFPCNVTTDTTDHTLTFQSKNIGP